MTLQIIPGGLISPLPPPNRLSRNIAGTQYTSFLIDAAGEKFATYLNIPKTGTLSKVHFLLGAVTTAEDLKVSFQDASLVTGDPDGGVDEFRVVASASVISDTWITTGIMSDDGSDIGNKRSVTQGDRLFVVIESNVAVADVNFKAIQADTRGTFVNSVYVDLFTAAWAKTVSVNPIIALEYDDASIEMIYGAYPFSSWVLTSFNNTSNPDENALIFQLPSAVEVNGFWVSISPTGNFDVVLYDSDGSSVLLSESIDQDETMESGGSVYAQLFSSAVTLLASTNYRISLKPSSGTNVAIPIITVDSALILDGWHGGQNHHLSTRVDAGGWSETTTKRPMIGVIISKIHDGAGVGGGASSVFGQNILRG